MPLDKLQLNNERQYKNTLLGISLMLVSTLAFAGMHACIRLVSDTIHPFEAAFFRHLFGLLVLLPVFFRDGFASLHTTNLNLHVARGTVQACQGLLAFLAITLAPLAKVTAVQFTAPLFTTLAAVLILKERLSVGRIITLFIGFSGVCIVIQPGIGRLDIGTTAALISAVFFAANIILVKILAEKESSVTITIYQNVIATPIVLVIAIFYWSTPTIWDLFWLFLLGTFGTIAHICLAEACKVADVTALLPFDYMRLVWAGLIGYLLFFETPDHWTILGGTVIFACGLYLLYYERKSTKKADNIYGTNES